MDDPCQKLSYNKKKKEQRIFQFPNNQGYIVCQLNDNIQYQTLAILDSKKQVQQYNKPFLKKLVMKIKHKEKKK